MNVYEIVTDRIIKQLEQGIIPWQKPWTGLTSGAISRSTGKPYSFLNQLLLEKPGEYLTFQQVQEAGGKVKKGEKSSIVVFFKPLPVKETNESGDEIEKLVPFLRYYNVFHIDQCEGIAPKYPVDLDTDNLTYFDLMEEAEKLAFDYIDREGIKFSPIAGDSAHYNPSRDEVVVPLPEQFENAPEYYGTLFHELTHSTGHKSRLDRLNKIAAFGSKDYSKEELVAELGAAFILNTLGIETKYTVQNNAAYIQSWLQALKNDSKMIVSAASKAEKAVNYIMTGGAN